MKIELVGLDDASTWTSINLVASLLMTVCTDTSLNNAYTGGEATAGNGGRLRVTLERSEEGVGARNGSSLYSEQ